MIADSLPKFDFRRSGFIDPGIRAVIETWMGKACAVFIERWNEMSSTPVKAVTEAPFTQAFATTIGMMEEMATGCMLQIGKEKLNSLLSVPRAGLISLISQIVCDPQDQMPEPRELTQIESQLALLLFNAFQAAAGEGWPQKESLPVTCGPLDSLPQKSRVFASDEFMIVIPLTITGTAGPVTWNWAIPRTALVRMLNPLTGQQPEPAGAPNNPEASVLEIPVQLTVRLGGCDLTMNELVELGVGDLIILDQTIDQPLELLIDNDLVFRGWPGRAGSIQAMKISDCI